MHCVIFHGAGCDVLCTLKQALDGIAIGDHCDLCVKPVEFCVWYDYV